jgi:hypothetical protein
MRVVDGLFAERDPLAARAIPGSRATKPEPEPAIVVGRAVDQRQLRRIAAFRCRRRRGRT